jgi:hypothetical protein
MASVITNNVSALAALANGLLPLSKVGNGRPQNTRNIVNDLTVRQIPSA